MDKVIFRTALALALHAVLSPGAGADAPQRTVKGVELHTGGECALPKDGAAPRLKADAGVRVRTVNGTAIAAAALGSTPGDALLQDLAHTMEEKGSVRYGASYTLRHPDLPFTATAAAGTLRFSRSISRLRNPLLPSAAALRAAPVLAAGIAPALPSFTDSATPAALALTVTPKEPPFPTVQLAGTADGEYYAGAWSTVPLAYGASLTVGATAGSFRYGREAEEDAPWFQKARPFLDGSYSALELACGAELPFLRGFVAAGLHQNPFGGTFAWLRATGSLVLPRCTCIAELFLADPALITAKGSDPRAYLQARLNPQCTFRLPGTAPLLLRAGVLGEVSLERTQALVPQDYRACTAKAGLSLTGKSFTLAAGGTARQAAEGKPWETSAKAALTVRTAACSATTSAGMERTGTTLTCTFSQSVSPLSGALSAVSAGGSVSVRGGEVAKGTAQASVAFKKRLGTLTVSAKCAVSATF